MKIKYQYTKNQTFREITKEREDVVKIIENPLEGGTTKIYERKGTCIIFSQNNKSKHASISNLSRPVQEWEIEYAVGQILRAENENLSMYMTKSGVIHIHQEEINVLVN